MLLCKYFTVVLQISMHFAAVQMNHPRVPEVPTAGACCNVLGIHLQTRAIMAVAVVAFTVEVVRKEARKSEVGE